MYKTPGAKTFTSSLIVRDENRQVSDTATQLISNIQVPVACLFILKQGANAYQANLTKSFGQGTLDYAYTIVISELQGPNETFTIPYTTSGTSITGAHDITLASTHTVTITGNIETPLFTFNTLNDYSITITAYAKDSNGITSAGSTLVGSIESQDIPTAAIVITTTANTMERTFSGTTSSDNGCSTPGLTYSWTITKDSDSSTITTNTGSSFSHTFTESTAYTVELEVTSACGSDTTTQAFTIPVNAPTANFSTASGSTTVEKVFTSTSISNCTPSTLTYAWTILRPDLTTLDSGTSNAITTTFDTDGDHTIRLQVTNACGTQSDTHEETLAITIPQVSGSINIANGAGSRERDFSITGATSTPSCTPATYTYSWTVYDTDLTTPLTTGSASTLNYTFAGDGTYRVTCSLSNACGDTVLLDESVPVTTAAPIAALTINDSTGTPLQISWDATGSSDNGCNPAGLTYQVRVYDTDDTTVLNTSASSTGTYTVPYNGSFRVRLDVTSSCGTAFDEETAVFNLLPVASQAAPSHAGSGVYTLSDTSTAYDADSVPDDLSWSVNIENETIETSGYVARGGSFAGLDHLSGTVSGGSWDVADLATRILYIVLDDVEPMTCSRLSTVVAGGITFNATSYSSVTAFRDAVLTLYSGNIAYDSTNCLFIWTGATPPTVSKILIYTASSYTLGTPALNAALSQYSYSCTFNESTTDYHTIEIKENTTVILRFHCKTGANLSLGSVVATAPSSLSGNEVNVDTGTFTASEWGSVTLNDGNSILFNAHTFRENNSLDESGFLHGRTPDNLTVKHTATLTTTGSQGSNSITIGYNTQAPTYSSPIWASANDDQLLVVCDSGSHNVYIVDVSTGERQVIAGAQPPSTSSGTNSTGTSTGNLISFNSPSSVSWDTSGTPTVVNGVNVYPIIAWDSTTNNIVELDYNGATTYANFDSDSNYSTGDGTGFNVRVIADPNVSRRANGKPTLWLWIDAFCRIKQWNGTIWITSDQFSQSLSAEPDEVIMWNDSFLSARADSTGDTTNMYLSEHAGTWNSGTGWSTTTILTLSTYTNPITGIYVRGTDGNGNPQILYTRLNNTIIYELTADVAAPTSASDWSSSTWLSDSSLSQLRSLRSPGDGYLYGISSAGTYDIVKINLTTKAIDTTLTGSGTGNVDTLKG